MEKIQIVFQVFFIRYFCGDTYIYTLHTSSTRSHTAHSFYILNPPFFAIHSITVSFCFSSITLFVVYLSFNISPSIFLFLSLSLSISMSISCLFDSFVFSCASSRAPPYLLAHRRYLHCVPMSELIHAKCFRDRCNERGIDSQEMENVTPGCSDASILPRRTKSHIHPSQRKMTLNFLPCTYLAEKGASAFTFHRSAFCEQRRP